MCKGDDQGDDDRRIIPSRSSSSNSAFAADNLSLSRRRARAWTGGPEVGIWCTTPCLLSRKVGIKSSGKSSRMASYFECTLCIPGRGECVGLALTMVPPSSETNLLLLRSIARRWQVKKSAPNISWVTSAIQNFCLKSVVLLSFREIGRFP